MAKREENWRDEIGEPAMGDIRDELETAERFRRDIAGMRYMMDEIIMSYEGYPVEYPPTPRRMDDWSVQIPYIEQDIRKAIKDSDTRQTLLDELKLVEKNLWKQHIPYLAGSIEAYGARRFLKKKSRVDLSSAVDEIEDLLKQDADQVLPKELRDKTEGVHFTQEAEGLRERFNDYDKEPNTWAVRRQYKDAHREANVILSDLINTYLYQYEPGRIEKADSLERFRKRVGKAREKADELSQNFEGIKDVEIKKRYAALNQEGQEFAQNLELTVGLLQRHIIAQNQIHEISQRMDAAGGVVSAEDKETLRGIVREMERLKNDARGVRDYEMHLQLIYFFILLDKEVEKIWAMGGMGELGGAGSTRPKNPDLAKYYKALGLEADAGESAVKQAYRNLMARWHQETRGGADVKMGDEAHDRAVALTEAYSLLKKAGLAK